MLSDKLLKAFYDADGQQRVICGGCLGMVEGVSIPNDDTEFCAWWEGYAHRLRGVDEQMADIRAKARA